MSDEMLMKAKKIYADMLDMFNAEGLDFYQYDDDFTVKIGIRGDDMSFEFLMFLTPEKELIRFMTILPFRVPKESLIDVAIAINVANFGLINGAFEYNIDADEIRFKFVQSYSGVDDCSELLRYVLYTAISTVNAYNSKLLAISKGYITINDFIEKEEKN